MSKSNFKYHSGIINQSTVFYISFWPILVDLFYWNVYKQLFPGKYFIRESMQSQITLTINEKQRQCRRRHAVHLMTPYSNTSTAIKKIATQFIALKCPWISSANIVCQNPRDPLKTTVN